MSKPNASLVLVSRIALDKWFHLPFLVVLRDQKLRQYNLRLKIIGSKDQQAFRILFLEAHYLEVASYVDFIPQMKIQDIFESYKDSIFVTGSNQGFLGTLGLDVIDANLPLMCYNVGLSKIKSSTMFSNTQSEFASNIFSVISNQTSLQSLMYENKQYKDRYQLSDDDKTLLRRIYKI